MSSRYRKIDQATLSGARREDPLAQEKLYRELGPFVYTLARRMLGSAAQAEDVLHETFLEVLTKIGEFRGECEVSAWVRRIAVNKCLMHRRSGWVARRVDVDPCDVGAGEPTAEPFWAPLDAALDALPQPTRIVVWLHDVEGYTHKEIGRLMGRTASFSKSQLARAHERLRSLLQDEPECVVRKTDVGTN